MRIRPATVPTAAGLTACLRDGQWRELRRSAGGRSVELVTPDGSGRMWVSAATFLPARLTETTPTPYGPTVISFTFRFLPPTAANEARARAAGAGRLHPDADSGLTVCRRTRNDGSIKSDREWRLRDRPAPG